MSVSVLCERMARRVSARVLIVVLPLVLILAWGQLDALVWAQQQEPSPIDIELIVPEQAGPGTAVDVLIKYDVVDPNAGADINYNIFGPSQVLTRDPEPPNPAYNTWIPGPEQLQGTIKIRLQVQEGTDGQTISHQVEVRWGIKAVRFAAQTLVKPLPPAPTATPRPRPRQPTPAPTPTPTVELEQPEIELHQVSLVDSDGQVLSMAQANQEIALEATYASSGDLQDVTVEIRFEPDTVDLDLPKADDRYVLELATLLAAADEAPLFEQPLKGRIRAYEGGGDSYTLQAVVRIVPAGGVTDAQVPELVSEPVQVSQPLSLGLSARVETKVIQAGETFIVRALVENPGSVTASQVRLALSGLAKEFVVSPSEQMIDQVAANGGTEGRVFEVRSPDEFDGQVVLRVVATVDEKILDSEPLTVQVDAPKPLLLGISASAPVVYAGEAVYVDASATNESVFEARGVTARLIDVSGNLGVQLQSVGDIGPGESREWVFVVQVPEDFPIDTKTSLVIQTISEDGITSQSPAIELTVSCRPDLKVLVEPPVGRLRGGDSAEAIVRVENSGQCVARDVSVSLTGLPDSFVQPPAQQIIELSPGEVRYATFQVLIPQPYRGDVALVVQVTNGQGIESLSSPEGMTVGGLPPVVTIVFGLLILTAAMIGVVGAVLYFRKRSNE